MSSPQIIVAASSANETEWRVDAAYLLGVLTEDATPEKKIQIVCATLAKAWANGRGAGIDHERTRCAEVVEMARFGEMDKDFRTIIYWINSGDSVEQIKSMI